MAFLIGVTIFWSTGYAETVNISSITMAMTQRPQAGDSVTVTANATSDPVQTVYYKFFYRGDYGTAQYDSAPWVVVQDYSTSNSCEYTFPGDESYIVVVRAVTDVNNEPVALPIIGGVVTVGTPSFNSVSRVNITGLSSNATGTVRVNEPVTFTVTGINAAQGSAYCKFFYRANYGTAQYDSTVWTVVQGYSTSNTCTYSFPEEGSYIMVARMVADQNNEPDDLPIIGVTVNVLDQIEISSTAFSEGSQIPLKYTCDGMNISPPLAISHIPPGTQSLALIADDPDAPGRTWVHWVLFNLPAATTQLSENIAPVPNLANGARQGINDFGNYGYGGPCPPSGTHRYYFKVYALDISLNLAAGATKDQVKTAMTGHILSQTQLMGLYGN